MDVLGAFSRWPRPLRSRRLLLLLLLYRVTLCLTLQTAESPDAWWQSEEVAYKMVFGRGQLTWEWEEAIRSYVFPAIFAAPLLLLKCTGTDTSLTVWASSRCVQALIFFAHDCTMLALAQHLDDLRSGLESRRTGRDAFSAPLSSTVSESTKAKRRAPTIASTTLAVVVVQWFLVNTGVRSYSNVPESLFVLLSLYQTSYPLFLLWAGVACAMRVTAAFAAFPIFAMHACRLYGQMGVARHLFIALITVGMAVGISAGVCFVDYSFYHRLLFTPYNFLKFNCLLGVSKYYGVHAPYWYCLALPAMAAPFVFFLAWMPVCWSYVQEAEKHHMSGSRPHPKSTLFSGSSSQTLRQEIKRWAFVGAPTLMVYSSLQHKEMRFIYFLLPLLLLISSVVVVLLCTGSPSALKQSGGVQRRCWCLAVPSADMVRRLFTLSWVASAVFTIVLLYGYRRGAPTLFREIRGSDWHFGHLETLVRCYGTPGYAQLHGKVDRLEWVDCQMRLDAVSGVPEVTQDRLFTEQPKSYALWRYLRLASRVDVEDVGKESVGKLSKDAWWREMRRVMPEGEAPALPDAIILFQKTAILLEADLLRPMGYRRLVVTLHAPHSFEEHEDRYLELWSRETAQNSES
ncbi:GPI alpha-mannosyltransferase III [Leishmania major strain Friedlin]|uniref:Mannosyltransferase n=1 Tax=Leishmania major TaxID=5664 RepID=Q4Q1V6_LEIMA|nr:GPI alpha-mannosyltransferase III [Leishmania major strain Friedlin]CAG9583638.1 GPI_alpha-mannosyltransferase_III [Leishmania major strain Friedlin]CAJ09073.1 GPI alpha-mannosyltransferase III [Leishmania major strain Friedlin]|eukprot:XP_001686692.1 GPI alpha-mannosyltransferase III [Leishmania major strain Friedlin]